MRCTCCNKVLNDYESTLKHAETGAYIDVCVKCLDGLGIPVVGRKDLNPFDDYIDPVESVNEALDH